MQMEYKIIIILQCISIVLLSAESIYIFQKWKARQHSFLFLYSAATLINNLGYLMEVTSSSSETALMGTKICYLGKVFIPLAFLAVIVEFCKVKIPRWVYHLLSLVHMLIFVSVLTCEKQGLFYESWSYTNEGLFPHNVFVHGPLYNIYMGIFVFYSLFGLFILIKRIAKETSSNRKSIEILFLCSIIVEIGGFIIFISGVTGGYDSTALGYTLGTVLMYIAIFGHDLLSFMDIAKNYALDNLTDGIIAVDSDDDILFFNKPVEQLFPDINKNRQGVLQTIKNAVEENKVLFFEDEVYAVELNGLSKWKNIGGTLYSIKNVTDSYYYSHRLEQEVALKTEELKIAQNAIITGMATMVESRDNSTGGHIKRTSDCVQLFTQYLLETNAYPDLDKQYYMNLAAAAPMHDLGKIAVDDDILRKPGKFTPDEFEKMKKHSAEGARIVTEILKDSENSVFREVAVNMAHYHHEKWNGGGYPLGIAGEEIPFEARVMALADVFDALVSKRVYKESFSYDKAFEIIDESIGSHFDPDLGKRFLEIRPQLEALYDSYSK